MAPGRLVRTPSRGFLLDPIWQFAGPCNAELGNQGPGALFFTRIVIEKAVAIMRYRTLTAGILLVAALAIVPGTFSEGRAQKGPGTEQQAPKDCVADKSPFAGKVLMLVNRRDNVNTTLQNARVKRMGGRTFLVGQYVKPSASEVAVPDVSRGLKGAFRRFSMARD